MLKKSVNSKFSKSNTGTKKSYKVKTETGQSEQINRTHGCKTPTWENQNFNLQTRNKLLPTFFMIKSDVHIVAYEESRFYSEACHETSEF